MTATGGAGRRAWSEQIMGMPISLHIREAAEGRSTGSVVSEVFAWLRAVDRTFSTYRPDSAVSRLNRGELDVADAVPELRAVLDLSDEARQRTGGYFDVMLPGPDGRPRFDPSGLVKGWAVERATALLTAGDVADFCLNAGGDIVLRAGPDQPEWRVGVEDPAAPDRLVAVLPVRSGAVATSGTARRGPHVIDPYTGRAAVALASVTVSGPSLTWADVYATAILARGVAEPTWLAHPTGYPALVVDAAGTLTATDGLDWRLPDQPGSDAPGESEAAALQGTNRLAQVTARVSGCATESTARAA
ncbi:FAD:protein FMN transferase [Plantactinospora sp. B24E8]|uniref:FAD:protein FMN transferase n=1 Tax=Plantactinospora sp. B24E8 TaxID=3153567 RepID=UPI00325DEF05